MKRVYRVGMFCLMGAILLGGAYRYRRHRLQGELAQQVLRFHVIANSDSLEDQDLKLKIRDEIGAYLGEELKGISNRKECEQAVNGRLAQIEGCAREVMAREGYDYSVDAFVADASFPDKTYGEYTFPGGEYRALKVVIGDGKGKNWWCVMYPNLCFSGSVYEAAKEGAKEELKAVLTEEEYAELRAEGELTVRFKYLDGLLSLFGL